MKITIHKFILLTGCILVTVLASCVSDASASEEEHDGEEPSEVNQNEPVPAIPLLAIGIMDYPGGPPMETKTAEEFIIVVNISESNFMGMPVPPIENAVSFNAYLEFDSSKMEVLEIRPGELIKNEDWDIESFSESSNPGSTGNQGNVNISCSAPQGTSITGHGYLVELICRTKQNAGGFCIFVLRGGTLDPNDKKEFSYTGFFKNTDNEDILIGSDSPPFLEISNAINIVPEEIMITTVNYEYNKVVFTVTEEIFNEFMHIEWELELFKNGDSFMNVTPFMPKAFKEQKIHIPPDFEINPGDEFVLYYNIEKNNRQIKGETEVFTVSQNHTYPLNIGEVLKDYHFTELTLTHNERNLETFNSTTKPNIYFELNHLGPVFLYVSVFDSQHRFIWGEAYPPHMNPLQIVIPIDSSWPDGEYILECIAENLFDVTRTTEARERVEFIIEN